MFNSLLFVHLVIAVLLIIVILLQKTSSDGLSGLGSGNNMGIISGRSAASFLTRITIILAAIFFVNSLILANLSTNSYDISKELKLLEEKTRQNNKPVDNSAVPMAK